MDTSRISYKKVDKEIIARIPKKYVKEMKSIFRGALFNGSDCTWRIKYTAKNASLLDALIEKTNKELDESIAFFEQYCADSKILELEGIIAQLKIELSEALSKAKQL